MSHKLSLVNGSTARYIDERIKCSIDVSTEQFPISEQFEVFRDAHQNVVDVDLVRSRDASFHARQMVWDFGRLVFTSTELPGKGYAHRRRHLRDGSLDHWYVTIPVNSSRYFESDTRPSAPSVHCLARPLEVESEDDAFLTLFIPRDLVSSIRGIDDRLNMRVDGACGVLLADYLVLLRHSLPGLSVTEAPHVFEATRHLVAACLAPSQDRIAEAQRPIDAIILEQVRKAIDKRLADKDLKPESLCSGLGLSRSRLYRLFEPLGGVSTYIRHQRLVKTRDALADVDDRRSISRIAEEWGFIDPSAYSRAFRQEFGISPSEAREQGWVDGALPARQSIPPSTDTKPSLGYLLRALSA